MGRSVRTARIAELDTRAVRRLALARAGLLHPEWAGFPLRAGRSKRSAREAAVEIIRNIGYLQLDTVSIAGARSHTLVLLSRLKSFPAPLGEELLRPGAPLYEYWGHEACWLPMESYPLFAFRRREFRKHPWWGDVIHKHRALARDILARVRDEGPVMSTDLEGKDGGGWWQHKPAKKVVSALWSSGDLVVRERNAFRRVFDLPERVIPEELRQAETPIGEAIPELLYRALAGHGWAQTRTLKDTWRLLRMQPRIQAGLRRLVDAGRIVPCVHRMEGARSQNGWIRPEDLELAERLRELPLRSSRAVLLSPFDPVLWDRKRVADLFGFDQVLEIFKPAPQRTYGYFCLPVLSGDQLFARVDLKANRKRGTLRVLSRRYESTQGARPQFAAEATRLGAALERYARQVRLDLA